MNLCTRTMIPRGELMVKIYCQVVEIETFQIWDNFFSMYNSKWKYVQGYWHGWKYFMSDTT